MDRKLAGIWIPYQRERWTTPDQDFIDVDRVPAEPNHKQNIELVLFHGLEGSSRGHYALKFASAAMQRGWSYAVAHFRGCSGTINTAPRAYHSGDTQEIDWILTQIKVRHKGPVVAVGISLGGNALMKWAGEMGLSARHKLQALASISAPLDLWQSGNHLGRPLNRYVYTAMFLRTMKRKAQQKHAQYPKLFDLEATLNAQTLYAFDDAFTAPLHGFHNTEHYWKSASAIGGLKNIKVPALVINALNDPFIPRGSLPHRGQVSSHVELFQPSTGGHVGFTSGGKSSNDIADQVLSWLKAHL
jgi:predicted alpha/beta-fold hydrolase